MVGKEKLEYLEHEDVETMGKKTAELRFEEAEEEKKRIASLKTEGKPAEAEEKIPKTPTQELKKEDSEQKTNFKILSFPQKIFIRLLYLFLFAGIVFSIYWFLIR